MKRYKQFEPVRIADFETATWEHPLHNHNHYELIYIKHGRGIHHINRQSVPYQSRDLFLLGPDEEHSFHIAKRTRFIYLKFTDLYIHRSEPGEQSGLHALEYLIKCRELRLSKFEIAEPDRVLVEQIYNVVIALNENGSRNDQLIWLQILALSCLLKRNLGKMLTGHVGGRTMEAIYAYVHEHVYTPEYLRAEVMASHFRMSSTYIGPYFKKNNGSSLRSYIRDYRLALINKRIKNGKYTLKEIASEFGLADESHVLKITKNNSRNYTSDWEV